MAKMEINKAAALNILANFALKSALKIAESVNGGALETKHGRKLSVEGFVEYIVEEGKVGKPVAEMLSDYLTSETLHKYEARKAISASKARDRKELDDAILASWDVI